MYRRILVAVDGSATSNKALVAALEMASYSGGRSAIRLIHVLDALVYLPGLDPHAGQFGSAISAMRDAGKRYWLMRWRLFSPQACRPTRCWWTAWERTWLKPSPHKPRNGMPAWSWWERTAGGVWVEC